MSTFSPHDDRAKSTRPAGRLGRVLMLGSVFGLLCALGIPAATGATQAGTISLSVLGCATKASGAPPPRDPPTSIETSLATAVARRLAFYSNGYLTLLAPRGGRCRAVIAADGALWMTVDNPLTGSFRRPVGASLFPQAARRAPQEAVAAYVPAPSSGPAFALACAFFPQAVQFSPTPDGCSPQPEGEIRKHASRSLVRFTDPPHAAGSGYPSGGTNPANGVAVYQHGRGNPPRRAVALAATCTLPASDQQLCTAVLNDFVRRAPQSGVS